MGWWSTDLRDIPCNVPKLTPKSRLARITS
jgi:hypothetical protein